MAPHPDDDPAGLTLQDLVYQAQVLKWGTLILGDSLWLHAKVNKTFGDYLVSHPLVVNHFLVPSRQRGRLTVAERSKRAMTIKTALMDWIKAGKHARYFVYRRNPDNPSRYIPVLCVLENKLCLPAFGVEEEKLLAVYVVGKVKSRRSVMKKTITNVKFRRGQLQLSGSFKPESPTEDDTKAFEETIPPLVASKALSSSYTELVEQAKKYQNSQRNSRLCSAWRMMLYLRPGKVKEMEDSLSRLFQVQEMLQECENILSPCECWEDVFTPQARCTHGNHCGSCRGCRTRFAQALFVIISAQGVGDKTILPHWAAAFRHPLYEKFSLEEYAKLEVSALAMLFRPTSHQYLSAATLHHILEVMAFKEDLPVSIPELTCFHGIQKKSAVLILQTVYNRSFGIAVDRHLVTGFNQLGWCHEQASNKTYATQISYMVEYWMKDVDAMKVNNLIAGLRMNLRDARHKDTCEAIARSLGESHWQDLSKLK